MKIRDEIEKHSADSDKPVLLWLFDRYHWASEWSFVAACQHTRYGIHSYQTARAWAPSKEGRALYEFAKLKGGEL